MTYAQVVSSWLGPAPADPERYCSSGIGSTGLIGFGWGGA